METVILLRKELAGRPEHIALVERYSDSLNSCIGGQLLSRVDDSPFPLGDWFDAFVAMNEWLGEQGKDASFGDQFGFVECAESTVSATFLESSLSDVVEQMLKTYGFERAL